MNRRCIAAGVAACVLVGLVSALCLADVCFCWKSDGSASDCKPVKANEKCSTICKGYENSYRVQTNSATCEGPDGILPASKDKEKGKDLDNHGGANEKIRWRYVVVVGYKYVNGIRVRGCRIKEGECQEWHMLVRCWSDDNHDCKAGKTIPGYTGKWVTIGKAPPCKCVGKTKAERQKTWEEYDGLGGCKTLNFHYHEYCDCREPVYYAVKDPKDNRPPAKPWEKAGPHGVPFPMDGQGRVWIYKDNAKRDEGEVKLWSIELHGESAGNYSIANAYGYTKGNPPTMRRGLVTKIEDEAGPPKKRTFTVTFNPQPDWEVAELKRDVAKGVGSGKTGITVKLPKPLCTKLRIVDRSFRMEDSTFGVWTVLDDPFCGGQRVTDVCLFPADVAIDSCGGQSLVAGDHAGTWTHEVIYASPTGDEHPLGGIRWSTDGAGLAPDDRFDLLAMMTGPADGAYDLYAYDANLDEWQYFYIDTTLDWESLAEPIVEPTPVEEPVSVFDCDCGEPVSVPEESLEIWATALRSYQEVLGFADVLAARLLAGDGVSVMLEQFSLYLDGELPSRIPCIHASTQILREFVDQASEEEIKGLACIFAQTYVKAGDP